MMNKAHSTDSDIASTSGSKPIDQQQQQHEVNILAPRSPNLPKQDLIEAREEYKRIGVPLYEASIKCDWKAAKAILDENPELVRYSLTETRDTALHISATVKRSKHAETFVENLVNMTDTEDLALKNTYGNAALFAAAANGNIKTVRVLVKRSRTLTTIPGRSRMMPLHAAALYGHSEVVKYLYENSNELCDDSWNYGNRGSLFQTCVEGDMFDIALKIKKKYPELKSDVVLRILARKPYAFSETKTSIIKIKRSIALAFSFIGIKVGALEKESTALTLLRLIWEDILKKPKWEIDIILRGPPDWSKQDPKTVSGRAIQAMQLQNLISQHVAKMKEETTNIITRSQDSMNQKSKQTSIEEEQVVQLQSLISERLVTMHDETLRIIKVPLDSVNKDNIPVSSEGDLVLELQNIIFEHVANVHGKIQMIIETNRMDSLAPKLPGVIFEQIEKMELEYRRIIRKPRPTKMRHSSQVPFIAAETGNTNFLVELIRQYPDVIWRVNDDNQSIFHIGVKYRHEGIYNLLYDTGVMKNSITHRKDANDNNLLHLAGKLAMKERLVDVSGAALQMQRELLWFKEVQSMFSPTYRERKNKDGLTPHELFAEEHKELIKDGEKWMKETASQCMVVAALIATIVFAVAFTVPGGYNQNNGIPIFYQKPVFVVFVVADAMSLFLSSASILTFLSILTSRFAERDFEKSLPRKLMLGLLTLFFSIATMVVTFSISFYILYQKEMKWIPILMSVVAFIPVLLYIGLQVHMLADVFSSSYGSRYLFKPHKRILYYVNTRPQGVSEP